MLTVPRILMCNSSLVLNTCTNLFPCHYIIDSVQQCCIFFLALSRNTLWPIGMSIDAGEVCFFISCFMKIRHDFDVEVAIFEWLNNVMQFYLIIIIITSENCVGKKRRKPSPGTGAVDLIRPLFRSILATSQAARLNSLNLCNFLLLPPHFLARLVHHTEIIQSETDLSQL